MTAISNNDKEFLKTLREIVDVNLNNEQFSATQLANEVNLTRSELHTLLKKLTQQSVTQFIREIRLQHAYEKLKNNEATVAEIAYQVGFKSPAYFNYCFRDYYGFPPGEIKKTNINIDLLKDRSRRATRLKKSPRLNHLRKTHYIIVLLAISTVLIALLLIVNRNHEDKSVAILPFGNITEFETNDYFSDGLTTDLKHHLCRIQNLTTISVCKDFLADLKHQNLWETGKELGADYIVFGNLISLGDEIKIQLQIMDINKKAILFNDLFEQDSNSQYLLQNDIVRRILLWIKPSLTTDELLYLHRSLTRNPKAYEHYLKGCYLLNSKSPENLSPALDHFNMALNNDPNYSTVYEKIAEYHYLMGTYSRQNSGEHYFQAKIYAHKALQLDPKLSSAHAILGGVALWNDWDLNKAKEYLTKAIKMNHNCCNAQNLYAQYLVSSGKTKKALNLVRKTLKQNPEASNLQHTCYQIYFMLRDYESALQSTKNMQQDSNNKSDYYWLELQALYYLGKYDLVALKVEEILRLNPATLAHANMVQHSYNREGITSVLQLLEHALQSSIFKTPYEVAQFYAILKDYKKTLQWLHKAYHQHTPELISVKYNSLFKDLTHLKEYQQLLDLIYS
ncbi:helix-turn-helix domain-containing protein [Puteibacter caeruleilacunae]|nr:helix-turn-helix domain-containing protein [Puteibacter caeruleilacunae]